MSDRTYAVRHPQLGLRIVRANTKAQARNHVAKSFRDSLGVTAADGDTLYLAGKDGITIEAAGEPVPEPTP